jgi:hypothetical protein
MAAAGSPGGSLECEGSALRDSTYDFGQKVRGEFSLA